MLLLINCHKVDEQILEIYLEASKPKKLIEINLHLTKTINPYNITPYKLSQIPPWILHNHTVLCYILKIDN